MAEVIAKRTVTPNAVVDMIVVEIANADSNSAEQSTIQIDVVAPARMRENFSSTTFDIERTFYALALRWKQLTAVRLTKGFDRRILRRRRQQRAKNMFHSGFGRDADRAAH